METRELERSEKKIDSLVYKEINVFFVVLICFHHFKKERQFILGICFGFVGGGIALSLRCICRINKTQGMHNFLREGGYKE